MGSFHKKSLDKKGYTVMFMKKKDIFFREIDRWGSFHKNILKQNSS